MTKQYSGEDIQVLTDIEHVRMRTQIYLGNTDVTQYDIPIFKDGKFEVKTLEFIPAVYKAVGEILDNSLDEFAQTTFVGKRLEIEATPSQGKYKVADNGRGIPIDKHESGKYTPEVALGSLRAGRNFTDAKTAGVIGQNGVGSACTNFCSTSFAVDILRDNKRYRQTFKDGGTVVSKPSFRKGVSSRTGTTVEFALDPEVFKNISLPEELIHNRAVEIALTNPGLTTQYNNETFKYKKGFEELIKLISARYFKFETKDVEFYVLFDVHQGIDEQMFSWVNSSLLFDGGICNTQFLNAFFDRSTNQLASAAKKNQCDVTKNDVKRNLLVLGNLKISDPSYDAQSKTRLTGPNMRREFGQMLDEQWASFARKHKIWFEEVLDRAMARSHADASKKAVKDHKKNLTKKIPGLIDATSKMRCDCRILITEGLSAASMITEARDPATIASLPLTGKVNNVYGTTVAKLLTMGKVTDLLSAIGLVPGQRALRSNLRYGKIIIATDADHDGSDIFTLLINLFYQFWPELFDPQYQPIVHRLVAPNVCLYKGNRRIHFPSLREYESKKGKYKGYSVAYYKGLGSMIREDWEMILSGKTDTLIPITDDGDMRETLRLLFSNDSNARKEWLQHD